MSAVRYHRSIISLFAKFCLLMLGLTTAALLLFVVPSLDSLYAKTRKDDVNDLAKGYSALVDNYIHDRMMMLKDMANSSVVVNSVMQDSRINNQLDDLMSNTKLMSSDAEFKIYNINNESFKGAIAITNEKYVKKISQEILLGKKDSGLVIDPVSRKVILISAISFGTSTEGILLAALKFDFNKVLFSNKSSSHVRISILENHNVLSMPDNKFKYPIQMKQELKYPHTYINVTIDMIEDYKKSQKILLLFSLKIILINFVCVLVLSFYGYKLLIKPYMQLEEKEKALSKTVEGIVKLDSDNRIIFANESMKSIFNNIHLENVNFLSIFKFNEDLQYALNTYSSDIQSAQVPFDKDDFVKIFKINVSYVINGDNEKYCFVSDVTKEAEMENMKQAFISIVSHELRTPLTSIQGSLGVIRKVSNNTFDEKIRELFDLCYKNANHLGILINDILDVERISAGEMTYELQPVDVNKQLDDIINECKGFAAKHEVEYVLHSNADRIHINIDPNRFKQAIENILSNAAKFSRPHSTVDIKVRLEDSEQVRISIIDKGKGIPKQMQSRIFSKFTQGKVSEHNKTKGTGLGLFITKSMVEAMHGSIYFESIEDVGTTFHIVFNIHQE